MGPGETDYIERECVYRLHRESLLMVPPLLIIAYQKSIVHCQHHKSGNKCHNNIFIIVTLKLQITVKFSNN